MAGGTLISVKSLMLLFCARAVREFADDPEPATLGSVEMTTKLLRRATVLVWTKARMTVFALRVELAATIFLEGMAYANLVTLHLDLLQFVSNASIWNRYATL